MKTEASSVGTNAEVQRTPGDAEDGESRISTPGRQDAKPRWSAAATQLAASRNRRDATNADATNAEACSVGLFSASIAPRRLRRISENLHRARLVSRLAPLLLCAFALSPLRLGAATNDLSGLLQKGLFEEEANRNLDAAVQAYQALVTAFDQDRKLAATAVFRLGECYRKLGKTNEAVLQYERIVREFADEATLATLSRQNLAGLGILPTKAPTGAVEGGEEGLEWSVAKARKEVASTEQELAMMEKTKKDDPQFLPAFLSAKDDELRHLLRLRGEKKRRLEVLKVSYSAEHPEVKVAQAELDSTANAINERVDGIMAGYRVRLQSLREQLANFEKELEKEASTKTRDAAVLSTAVAADDEETEIRRLQAMIQNSPDLINDASGGMTPLCQAASKGQLRVAKFLLDHGAAIDRKAGNQTPLHRAVARGHKPMVELLLQRGADVNARDGSWGTALHEAAQDGFLSIAEVLVQHKADLNARNSQMNDEQTPLHRAIEKDFNEMAAFLVSKGADVNAQTTKRGRTPLSMAASRGHVKILNGLLAAGAIVDSEDKDGLTPLAYAVSGGHLDCAKTLLAAGANPNGGKDGGALCWPGPVSQPEGVRLLLEAGANPNAKRADGQTPLLTATEKGYYESAVVLLKHGADVNATNSLGMTPLHMAVWAESQSMVSLLLTNHANVNAPGPVGRNALIMAKEAEDGFRPYTPGDYGGRSRTPDKEVARKIADLLRQHGAKEGSTTSEAAKPPEKP